jgi:hypothetical protein
MNDRLLRFYVVHDQRGRILGLAPILSEQVDQRFRLGYRPLPGPDERLTEVELTHEHSALAPHQLLEFEVAFDSQTGRPRLRRPPDATSNR